MLQKEIGFKKLSSLPKILIVCPPVAGSQGGVQGIYYPIGISYVAAVLKKKYDVSVYDFHYDYCMGKVIDQSFIENILKSRSHDFLLIGGVFPKLKFIKELILISRKISNVPIIIGGSYVKANLETIAGYLKADYYVIGEGENTIGLLMDSLINNKSVYDVSGIAYNSDSNPDIIKTVQTIPVSNLDKIPFPDRRLLDFHLYKRAFSIGSPLLYTAVLIGSRGCPLNCIFCNPNFGRKVRVRSPENIVEEIEVLQKDYNVKFIYFRDENLFGGGKQNIVKFCDYILTKGKNQFYWRGSTNARFLDCKTIAIMKRAGCTTISLGVESCSDTILKEMRKKNDLKQLREIVKACSNNQIEVEFSLITNSFSETEKTLHETENYLISLS
jgi:anaerobic magnesium-protoporphyrin IX monomethyl ester cyclase